MVLIVNSRKLTAKRVEAFLGRLEELVSALPSAENKAEMDRELDAVIGFLLDFKRRLNSVPTAEDAAGLEESIGTLRHYVRIAEADPLISKILGLQEQAKPRTAKKHRKHGEFDANQAVSELKSLTPDEMRRAMEDKTKFTIAVLRRIAELLTSANSR